MMKWLPLLNAHHYHDATLQDDKNLKVPPTETMPERPPLRSQIFDVCLFRKGLIFARQNLTMEHHFDLPVVYKGKELSYKGRLATFGYVYKFFIVVEGRELVFEKDEEGQYRVFAADEKIGKDTDPELVQVIVATLNELSV